VECEEKSLLALEQIFHWRISREQSLGIWKALWYSQ